MNGTWSQILCFLKLPISFGFVKLWYPRFRFRSKVKGSSQLPGPFPCSLPTRCRHPETEATNPSSITAMWKAICSIRNFDLNEWKHLHISWNYLRPLGWCGIYIDALQRCKSVLPIDAFINLQIQSRFRGNHLAWLVKLPMRACKSSKCRFVHSPNSVHNS